MFPRCFLIKISIYSYSCFLCSKLNKERNTRRASKFTSTPYSFLSRKIIERETFPRKSSLRYNLYLFERFDDYSNISSTGKETSSKSIQYRASRAIKRGDHIWKLLRETITFSLDKSLHELYIYRERETIRVRTNPFLNVFLLSTRFSNGYTHDATANGLVGDSSGNNCRAITGPPLLPVETLFFVSSWKRWGSKGLNLRDFNVLLETIAQRRRIVRNGSGIIVGDILHKGVRVYQRDGEYIWEKSGRRGCHGF